MPFERYDANISRSHERKAAVFIRRAKLPALFIVTILASVALYERGALRLGSSGPSTNIGWQSFLPAYGASRVNASTSSFLPGETDDFAQDWDEWGEYDGFVPQEAEDEWNPFTLNPRPIVEIQALSCVWPPSVYDTCYPESTHKEDNELGRWIRVEKDINMRVGVLYLYLFYRRLPVYSNAPTVRELRLVTKSERSSAGLTIEKGWTQVKQNLRDGILPSQEAIYLYYRTEARQRGAKYLDDEINELDVIWGSANVMYGWNRMHRDFAEPKEKNQVKQLDDGAELTWRKGSPQAPRAQLPLTFSTDGKYKILQVADLHFSVAKGKCLDSDWPGCKGPSGSDNATLDWLGDVLDDEKPDLVILSGDQLNGQDTSYSSESVILKVARLFAGRKIPWAAVLGNHDSEKTTLTRYGQLVMYQSLPYFVGEPGPLKVDGEGNYVLKLYSADESRTVLFTLYFLDSHAYKPSLNPWSSEYDYLKESQIQWLTNHSSSVKSIQRPYRPPILSDQTFGLWNRTPSVRRQSSYKKPNAFAIFHIPLPEVYDSKPDLDTKSKAPLVVGEIEEGRGAPKKNSRFFEKAVLAQTEIGPIRPVDTTVVESDPDYAAAVLGAKPEIKVIINGHCHLSDSCRRIKGVWNCFAGGSSYSGYGKVGFERRVRVLQLSDYGETVTTYKILDSHADHSGNVTASDKGQSSSPKAAEQADEVQQMLEAEAEYLEGQLEAAVAAMTGGQNFLANLLHRQKSSGRMVKIDEQILVGKGAPQ